MHQSKDIYSLTDFKQNTTEHLTRLRETGRPEILTVNGKAEAVVMSPAAYDRLVDLALADLRAKIDAGLEDVKAGRVIDGEEAFRARRAKRAAAQRRAG
jgi:prevent-host-death family protein